MKKAKNVKVGMIVQVPTNQFAPNRNGWNGYMFDGGKVTKLFTSTQGMPCATVEVHRNNGMVYEKNYLLQSCFDYSSNIIRAQKFIDDYTSEQFENATGTTWIKFLADEGIVTLK